ncbi:MAG: hypothetical protein KAR20_16625, partial [Candidatus Heimdallarchaeota archaeon]|nr:hypothetical protein [Candidatus Heimdallarchaeota archaeon]
VSDEFGVWVDDNITPGNTATLEKAFAITKEGYVTHPKQPCFLGIAGTAKNNVTGDGTVYTCIYDSQITDRGNNFNPATGTFTMPIANDMSLIANISAGGITSNHDEVSADIVTSNRSYRTGNYSPTGNSYTLLHMCVAVAAADMDAADTAHCTLLVNGTGAAKVVNYENNGRFSGVMV